MAFLEKTINNLQNRFTALTSEQKRRFALICTAVVVVLLTISVIISIRNSDGEEGLSSADLSADKSADKSANELEIFQINVPIPAEELFLPDEPDFLPGVYLERERRSSWTEQDAQEFWQDPLRFGEEQWREKIKTAVDELLERVP